MSAAEKPPRPCRVCDRGPADDAGATWQDETCSGCGRYRIAAEPDPKRARAEAARALVAWVKSASRKA